MEHSLVTIVLEAYGSSLAHCGTMRSTLNHFPTVSNPDRKGVEIVEFLGVTSFSFCSQIFQCVNR